MKTKKTANKCSKCGYTKIHLHNDECPLCKPCDTCSKPVRKCICKEGE